MSLAEITSAIDHSPEERSLVSTYLRRRFCDDTPERQSDLSDIMDEMDTGKKFTLAQLRRTDKELKAR